MLLDPPKLKMNGWIDDCLEEWSSWIAKSALFISLGNTYGDIIFTDSIVVPSYKFEWDESVNLNQFIVSGICIGLMWPPGGASITGIGGDKGLTWIY